MAEGTRVVRLRCPNGFYGTLEIPYTTGGTFIVDECRYSGCKKGGVRPAHRIDLKTGRCQTVFPNAENPGEILGLANGKGRDGQT
jgi:hypothetical protein